MMYRTNRKDIAQRTARECGLLFGLCVFDGCWYIGAMVSLEKIGCVEITDPKEEQCPKPSSTSL